jgi:hypothetical protein
VILGQLPWLLSLALAGYYCVLAGEVFHVSGILLALGWPIVAFVSLARLRSRLAVVGLLVIESSPARS